MLLGVLPGLPIVGGDRETGTTHRPPRKHTGGRVAVDPCGWWFAFAEGSSPFALLNRNLRHVAVLLP